MSTSEVLTYFREEGVQMSRPTLIRIAKENNWAYQRAHGTAVLFFRKKIEDYVTDVLSAFEVEDEKESK